MHVFGGSADAVVQTGADGLMVVTWRGAVTSDAADAIKRQIHASVPMPLAVLSDYSGAAIAMDADAMLQMMACADPWNAAHAPAAVVSSAVAIEGMRKAALHAAVSGYCRRVFARAENAPAWALEMARLIRSLPSAHRASKPQAQTLL